MNWKSLKVSTEAYEELQKARANVLSVDPLGPKSLSNTLLLALQKFNEGIKKYGAKYIKGNQKPRT